MISIVIPAYNEQENIGPVIDRIWSVFATIADPCEVILVDDGSTDATLTTIKEIAKVDSRVHYISLSRNFGHQNALKAGLDRARGDAVITMDADLQHPPELILRFLEKWRSGYDVVYSIRKQDPELTYLKRKSSAAFYSILNAVSDVKIEPGSADFRLMDRRVVNTLRGLNESELFLRGLIKWVGFKQIGIEYDPAKRHAGTTKYSFGKMVRFGIQGITSFSIRPLYTATYLGIVFALLSIVVYIPYISISFYSGHVVSGWTSVLATVVFLGGLQLMILGIMGIYLGKLFIQSKNRPNYIVDETNIPA